MKKTCDILFVAGIIFLSILFNLVSIYIHKSKFSERHDNIKYFNRFTELKKYLDERFEENNGRIGCISDTGAQANDLNHIRVQNACAPTTLEGEHNPGEGLDYKYYVGNFHSSLSYTISKDKILEFRGEKFRITKDFGSGVFVLESLIQ